MNFDFSPSAHLRTLRNLAAISMAFLLTTLSAGQSLGVSDTPTVNAKTAASIASAPQGAVPRLIKFSGSLRDAQGNLRTGVAGVMFSIYPEQVGSAPLWSETQNVTLDSQGRYTVLLGAEHAEGLSTELFAS